MQGSLPAYANMLGLAMVPCAHDISIQLLIWDT